MQFAVQHVRIGVIYFAPENQLMLIFQIVGSVANVLFLKCQLTILVQNLIPITQIEIRMLVNIVILIKQINSYPSIMA